MSTRARDIAAAVDRVVDAWLGLTDAERAAVPPLLATAIGGLDGAVSSAPKRADCPVCGDSFTLTVNGRLRHHLGTERDGRWRKECKGSRRTPDGAR